MEILFLVILVLLMISALGSGFPVAFALPGSAITAIALAAATGWLITGDPSAYFAQGGPVDWLTAGVTNFRGVYWEIERDTLIAIPLFVFMGIMLQRSRIAEELLVTMARLFGPVPGGLGISVIVVGALLAATTGIVGATVVAMGLISLPAMMRNNYSHSLATGTIMASGTLGQIIPPSIVLIILADQLSSAVDQASTARKALYKVATGETSMPSQFDVVSTSAGDMFMGALIPGLILVGLYIVYILGIALLRPAMAPAVRTHEKFDARFLFNVFMALVPPLTLIMVVLGSIIAGIATVNQAGAIGAAGAMVMASYKLTEGRPRAYWPAMIAIASLIVVLVVNAMNPVNIKSIVTPADSIALVVSLIAVAALSVALCWAAWRTYRIANTMAGVVIETAKTTALVFIILLGAAMLTAAFRGFGGEELVKEFLTSLPGGFWSQFLIVMAVIFVLGFFLDFIEIAVVVVPIVAPILLADPQANITAVWLGVMIGLNIQTSFLTPPFGFALFYLRGVAPKVVTTLSMYKGVVAFITLQLIALGIAGYYPPLVNYLPTRIAMLSETAPPPQNPRLQHCIEADNFGEIDANGDAIRASIVSIAAVDMSALPKPLGGQVKRFSDQTAQVFDRIAAVREAAQKVVEATPAYRPMHTLVRELERDAAKVEIEVVERELRIARLRGDPEDIARRKVALEQAIVELKAEKEELVTRIPAQWDATHDEFAKLTKAEEDARRAYRQAADNAYSPVVELIGQIQASAQLSSQRAALEGLRAIVAGPDAAAAEAAFADVGKAIAVVPGADPITSKLSDARRSLRGRNIDSQKAAGKLEEAIEAFGKEEAWRKEAAAKLLPALQAHEELIRDNLGLRQQPKLPREKALAVASCNSVHRDISLNF